MPNFAQAAFGRLMESHVMTYTKVQVHEQANLSHQSACGGEHALRALDRLKNVFFRGTLIYAPGASMGVLAQHTVFW